MCECGHEHEQRLTRRAAAKYFLGATLGVVAAIIPTRQARAGWGRCSQCTCQNYVGNQEQCGNCGHRYADHW